MGGDGYLASGAASPQRSVPHSHQQNCHAHSPNHQKVQRITEVMPLPYRMWRGGQIRWLTSALRPLFGATVGQRKQGRDDVLVCLFVSFCPQLPSATVTSKPSPAPVYHYMVCTVDGRAHPPFEPLPLVPCRLSWLSRMSCEQQQQIA